jgi:plasmid replication initiation protein
MDINKYAEKIKTKSHIKQKAIELVQPNKVTNAIYNYNETQENILILMIDAIQKHMTKELPIQTDLFGEPMIRINVNELGLTGYANKKRVLSYVEDLRIKSIRFEWQHPETKKQVETSTGLISAWHDYTDTPIIEITISKWAIPYLLYWGKGVGGTIFSKAIALKLPGNYTKRLYKLCKRWEDVGGFSMPLSEFREMLMLEGKYDRIIDLKKRVIEPAKKKMKEMADVYFTYSLEKVGGSRSYNFIHFAIHSNDKNREEGKKSDMYVFIYSMLSIAYPVVKSSKARDIADHLSQDNEAFEKLYFRLKGVRKDYDSGKIKHVDVVRLIKHIIKTDYGIS